MTSQISEVFVRTGSARNGIARCEADRIVGDVLREMRTDAGLSLDGASEIVGFGASVLGAWERCDRTCTLDQFIDVAHRYGVNADMAIAVIERRAELAKAGCRSEADRENRAALAGLNA